MGLFSNCRFLVKSLINKNCHNARTSNDIDIKLGPLTKLENKNAMMSKKIDDDVISAIYDFIIIFQFIADLEKSGT